MELWTGIACLVPDPTCKEFRTFGDGEKGAYVNIVAWADSEEEFRSRLQPAVTSLGCVLLELEKIQRLDKRMEEPGYPEELIEMRSTAQRQKDDIVFGTFHTWVQSDVN